MGFMGFIGLMGFMGFLRDTKRYNYIRDVIQNV